MEQDESIGEIYLNFLGPPPMDYRTNTALKLLGLYLTDTPTAPLQVEFVEIKQPLCTGIGIYSEDRVNHNEITMYLTDVPVKHLETLSGDVIAKLKAIVAAGIDMDRMSRVIRRDKRKLLNMMETSVSDVLSDAVIGGELMIESVADVKTSCMALLRARICPKLSMTWSTTMPSTAGLRMTGQSSLTSELISWKLSLISGIWRLPPRL